MKKKGLKQRIFSAFLAGTLAAASFYMVPPMEAYAEKGEGTVYAKRSFDSNYDAQYAYTGDDLGCTYTPQKTTFKVWTPEATSVVLCRYEKGNGGSVIEEVPMTKGDKGVWSVTINKDIVNTYYTYKVTVNGKPKEAVDIYAKAAGVNGDRAMVVDLDSTDPENWDTNYQREKTNLSDIIVWEVHVRDFSIDVSSGVSEQNRGKYKAFTEHTTVNGAGKVASCVDYLKELGVTHVQILPMYDYASVDETNVSTSLSSNYNWGYDPENYNVPEGSYSSNPYDGNVRITEKKEMIQALHDAGIKVIMDVVYNHTYDTADSNFNKIMPDYYYKLNSDLSYNNQSGCGNATRSESAMYRKFMIDSVSYWAEEYNLDGFRFDLMGIHDVTTMNQIRKTLDDKFGEDTIVLYGEGWTGDGKYDSNSAHKANEAKLDDGIGYFNDQIRDALKGDHKFNKTIGLVQTNYFSGSYLEPGQKWPNNVFGGIMGSVGKTEGEWGMWRPFWSKSSNCSLSYVSAHDNLTLWDKLTEGLGNNYSSTDERMIKMNKMAGSVVLSSKGGVFMQAGEEFARTKNGDENSYSSPDSVNKIDWNRVNTYSSIQKYYQGMIRIRKAFSGFRSITTRSGDNWNPNNNNLTWINKDENGLTGFYETNNVAGEWSRIAVLINNATSDKTVNLSGSNNWVIIADGNTAGLEKLKETGTNVTVPGKSVVVAVPKETFEACEVSENKAPVINVNSSFEVVAGESLSFTAEVSDPDGDAVTLTASGVPTGASFNTATGVFQWTKTVAGTYSVTLTASDGKKSTPKTVTITVTEKTAALKSLVTEINQKGYQKADFTEDVWKPFDTALTAAQQIINSGETEDTKIANALSQLKSAYENVKKEALAREELENTLSAAKTRMAAAKKDSANYDAAAIEDLQTVITKASEVMETPCVAEDYVSETEDLEDAMKACVSLKKNPVIRVKADGWSSPAVYVWKGTGTAAEELAGKWPGTKLSKKDAEGWYVYELPEGTTGYSLIVNDGAANTATQTADITGITASVDVTVTSFTGKTCAATKQEYAAGSGEVMVDKTRLSTVMNKAENVIKGNPDSTGVTVLTASYNSAKAVYEKAAATQVEVNQTVRDLKEKIKAVGNVIVCQHTNTVVHGEKEATCTEPGYTGDVYCSDCNKPVQNGETIPAKGHQWDDGVDQGNGYVKYTCKVCPETQVTREDGSFDVEIKAKQYVYDGKEKKPEVIATDGDTVLNENTDYTVIYQNNTNAGTATVIVTGKGNYKGTHKENFTIEKAEVPLNQPVDMNVSAENETLSDVELPPDWKWSDADKDKAIEKESTITVTAVYEGADKANYKTLSVEIKVTGIACTHEDKSKLEIRNKVEATCTDDGYTGDTFCINCQTYARHGEIVNAAGHQWKEEYTTDQVATCTESGRKSIHCSKCDAIKEGSTEIIIALGHTGGAATCSEKAICGRCRKEYGNYDKTRHIHTELRNKEEATVEKEGYTGDTYCQDCDTLLTKGEKIPKDSSSTTTGDKKPGDSSPATGDDKPADSQQSAKLPSTGTKLTDGTSGAVYEVTMANQAERTVTYLKPVDAEEKNITVPATMTMDGATYKVTVVAENAFKNNKKIEKVIIGKNVTDIEEKAFYGCSNLKNVSLGNDVNVIGESAFSGCKNLNKVSLNKNLIVIDDKAFYRCTKLSGVTIPSKVKAIGEDAFYGSKNLKKITIKTTKLTNKNVGKKAFKGISSKAVIKVPKNKAAAYKKLLQSKGISPKVKIKK
ncbi:MAG: type I pullulanase [Clostridiales bacterium]|nr:type I pullulanase [Clostridiales bacterium]